MSNTFKNLIVVLAVVGILIFGFAVVKYSEPVSAPVNSPEEKVEEPAKVWPCEEPCKE